MDQETLSEAKTFVRDLTDGQAVDAVFLVRERSHRHLSNGDPCLKLALGDLTGTLEAVVWEEVDEALAACGSGAVVRVRGAFARDPRQGASLTVHEIRLAEEHEYDARDLMDGPPHPLEQMIDDLQVLIATVQREPLRELLERFFSPGAPTWTRWRDAPAAKHYHQAYPHGLLEHSLSVAQSVSAVSSTFPGIDRDVAVAGALLHDIGKIEAYGSGGNGIELTDAGRLQGEIPLGYYLVRREMERMADFPPDVGQAVLHIILAHHGQLAHGSPVVPCTREATLVHMMDNLGGRLGSFDRLEKTLAEGEHWSSFDRALSGAAYFAPCPTPQRSAA